MTENFIVGALFYPRCLNQTFFPWNQLPFVCVIKPCINSDKNAKRSDDSGIQAALLKLFFQRLKRLCRFDGRACFGFEFGKLCPARGTTGQMFLDEGLGFLLHQFLGIQRQQITSDGARQFHGDPSIFSMIFVRARW